MTALVFTRHTCDTVTAAESFVVSQENIDLDSACDAYLQSPLWGEWRLQEITDMVNAFAVAFSKLDIFYSAQEYYRRQKELNEIEKCSRYKNCNDMIVVMDTKAL